MRSKASRDACSKVSPNSVLFLRHRQGRRNITGLGAKPVGADHWQILYRPEALRCCFLADMPAFRLRFAAVFRNDN